MIGYIYLIRNLINGKAYIGKTESSIELRFYKHKQSANSGSKCVLHQAMRKYGFENFAIIPLASCPLSLLNELEAHYIKFCGTHVDEGFGYNMTLGGDGSSGWQASPETKVKMAAAKRGKKRGPHSPSHRAKIAESQKGNVNGKGRKGQHHSKESREKIASSRKISNLQKKLK